MGIERRQHTRLQGPFDGTWQGAAGRRDARVVDLSVGGCFIDVMGAPHTGTLITVELRVAGHSAILAGEVVYVDNVQGFAVKFTETDPAALEQLELILKAISA